MPKLYLLLLLLMTAALPAQIVLTEDYLPVAGDTLRYSRGGAVPGVDLQSSGADLSWDLGFPEVTGNFQQVISAAPDDAPFAAADLVVQTDSFNQVYVSVDDGVYAIVGLSGELDVFPGYTFTTPVNPARPERRAPLAYGDTYTSTNTYQLVLSPDSLPTAVIEQYGSLLSGVDSIRLTARSEREDVVDAYGSLSLNGQTYDVLRERRTEILDNQIEFRIGILGYTNVTGLLLSADPTLAEVLGSQEPITTDYYWANGEKEAIATVTTDAGGTVTDFTFLRAEAVNSVGDPLQRQATVRLYPNPARTLATFELDGLTPGTYTLRLVNVLGRQVATRQFSPAGNSARLELDVSRLPRGTYLYSVTNERGRMLTTQRLLVGG